MNSSEPKLTSNQTTKEDYRKALRNYQRRISNILESFTDGFFEVNADWIVTYWNKEAERLLLMPRNEVLGKNLWEVYHDAVELKFFSEYHRAMANNVSVRFEEYFAPRNIWVEVAAFPTGDGLSVYFKDITERKKIMMELELEKQKYRDLFNSSPLPQWVYDVDSLNFLDVNEAAIHHYGYTREEFMNMTIAQIRPPGDIPALNKILEFGIIEKAPNTYSVRHKKKNGDIIEVFVEGNSVSFEGKNARMVMAIDRTAEVHAKQAMEESITRFNLVSKATSDAIWDWNMITGEMIWNQGIKGIFGYEKTVYSETWWQSRIHPGDLKRVLDKLNLLLKKQESRLSVEYRFLAANGEYRSVLDRAFIMFNEEGSPIRMIGSMQDVTERINQVQAIEEQNAKLKEISWIQAHKVRGPLSSILGLVELIKEGNLLNPEAKEFGHHLKSAAQELDDVLRDIVNKT